MSVLSERLKPLSPVHRRALEWFDSQRGELIGWPEPLEGLFLVNRPKGIHKPKGWRHALSVRQSLKSLYADRPPELTADGGWTYDYFQEGQNPEDRDRYASNRGLLACRDDDVPVAVLIQEKAKPGVQYRVWGLARVESWEVGHFRLRGYGVDGVIRPSLTADNDADFTVRPPSMATAAEPPHPISFEDARKKIAAEIVVRQGGAAFRKEALKRFGGRCAISDWDVVPVLEAAHIVPHLGVHTDTPDNALLLRADIHTLFDCDLLTIDPESLCVCLTDQLAGGPYGQLAGKLVALPQGVTAATFRMRLIERREAIRLSKSKAIEG